MLRCRIGMNDATPCTQPGMSSIGKNTPERNAIGSTIRFTAADAASSVRAMEPINRPTARKASVPAISSGRASHHEPRSCSPNAGVTATAMNTAAWATATTRLTPIRAPTTAAGDTGDMRRRRSTSLRRQVTRFIAAPKAADMATAHARRPEVRYWIGSKDSSSTCAESTVKRGGVPASSRFARPTTDWTIPCTVPAET